MLTLNLPSMLAECGSASASNDCRVVHLFGSPLGDAVGMTYMAIGLVMYAVPLVLGVPILTSEIERRTAMTALVPFRIAHEMARLAALDGFTFGVVGMVGIAGTIMLVNRRLPA